MPVAFNRPYATGRETGYIQEAITRGNISGGGIFTARCETWLEKHAGCAKAFLVSSCTAALEMAAMLMGAGPGDEIIMPSYTFVSTANAFAMQGALPVFVDIKPDTLTIDETLIEAAITPRTKAIVAMHYAGVACAMDAIMALAQKHGLYVIEDNAHGILARYRGKPLGGFGHLATLSFHETKNLTCGQGGALLVNDGRFTQPAYILRDKGTNRQAFEQGRAPFYTWVGKGSNYGLSEIQAAFLWAQLEDADRITHMRMESWQRYAQGFAELERKATVRLPGGDAPIEHNGHVFYLLLARQELRDGLIAWLAERQIGAAFHYVPLHISPAYRQRIAGPPPILPVTERVHSGLVRLPLWIGVEPFQDTVMEAVYAWADTLPKGEQCF